MTAPAPHDPWRKLATACSVLTVSGHATAEQVQRARSAYDDCVAFTDARDVAASASERLLREAFHAVDCLGFESKQARDALWAAVKLFGHCRSASHRTGAPEADATFWWLDK